MLEGDFYGLRGVAGVPVVVGPGGISRVVEFPLTDPEYGQIQAISKLVHRQVEGWMAGVAVNAFRRINPVLSMDMTPPTVSPSYAFVLKLTDQPGGMEVIAATFAHRGVSLACSLGNDGALDPEGRATMMVTFSATPAKKEIIRRALGRLSRVRSLVEYPMDAPELRKTAVLRLAGAEPLVPRRAVRSLERMESNVSSADGDRGGETTYLLVDTPVSVDAVLEDSPRRGSSARRFHDGHRIIRRSDTGHGVQSSSSDSMSMSMKEAVRASPSSWAAGTSSFNSAA